MPEGDKTKLKVVIDTNVFVSGLNFQGKPREILDLIWHGEIEVYISPFILEELKKSLSEDFNWSDKEINKVAEKIKKETIQVIPKIALSVVKSKVEDNQILECAVEAQVQYLISGDKQHLLPLKEYQGIIILSPSEFLLLQIP